MKNIIKVNSFLSEAENEIFDLLENNKGIFLCSRCGIGKSYFIKEILMKKKRTLVVNFLNILNQANFYDSYLEGKKRVEQYDGSTSATINVQNLEFVGDSALGNIECLVLDELQELYLSATYRAVAGDMLIAQLKRFRDRGIKLILMTGTPMGKTLREELGLASVEVIKKEIRDSDKYEFTFMKGLAYSNVAKETKRLLNKGKIVVLLSDLNRKRIRKLLLDNKISFLEFQSSDRQINNSATRYMINNQQLPKDVSVFLSTSVIAGGINLNELPDDREIVYVTFCKDINNPLRLIQLAGRSRNQKKVAIVGYEKDEDFNITYNHVIYDNQQQNLLKSNTVQEMEALLGDDFNELDDWSAYITRFCGKETKIFKEDFIIKKEKAETEETDWKKFIKLVKESKAKNISYNDYFKIKTEAGNNLTLIDSPSGYNKWLYCSNVVKARRILKALDLGYELENMDDSKIDRLLEVIYTAKMFCWLSDKDEYQDFRRDLLKNKIDLSIETLRNRFMEIFKVSKYVNGQKEELKDWQSSSRVCIPLKIFTDYEETVTALIRSFIAKYYLSIAFSIKSFSGYVLSFELEDDKVEEALEKKKEKEIEAKVSGGAKGGSKSKSNKKIKVISEANKRLKGLLNTEYASVNEASEKLGITRKSISQMIKKGLLEAV